MIQAAPPAGTPEYGVWLYDRLCEAQQAGTDRLLNFLLASPNLTAEAKGIVSMSHAYCRNVFNQEYLAGRQKMLAKAQPGNGGEAA